MTQTVADRVELCTGPGAGGPNEGRLPHRHRASPADTATKDPHHCLAALFGMSALRRRKVGGSAGDVAPAETSPEDGDDAPAQRARQPTVMENLERWGYACSVVGRMFSAIWQLLIAMALWVCPLCAREEKRRLR